MNKHSRIATVVAATMLVAGLFSDSSIAQEVPGAAQQKPIVLKNATLHPVDSEKIDKGMLLMLSLIHI